MKTPSLLSLCALVAVCGVATSCTGVLFKRTLPAVTTASHSKLPSPAFGTPAYVSELRPYGAPYERSGFYPYSAARPGGMGYYDRVASPHGSYEYLYHDMEVPHPAPGTRLKERTVRYTSHHPASWGAPVWVTSFKPAAFARRGGGTAAAPAAGSGSE